MEQIGGYLESLFSLKGKVILLTGAAGGIGEAFARGLAAAGGSVSLCDLNIRHCDEVVSELNGKNMDTKAYELDVADIESIKKCVAAVLNDFGRIDVLINCAGINKREGFLDVEE